MGTVAALVCVLALAVPALGQPEFSGLPEPGVPVFDLDAAVFRQGPDSARVEIYYRITNPHLSYVRRKGKYVASYEITVILNGRDNEPVATTDNRENYQLSTFEETRRASGYLVNVLTLTAGRGEYELRATLNDRISNGSYTTKRPIDLRHVGSNDWVIGGPEYILPGAPVPKNKRYYKGDIAIVPNVQRSFAGVEDRLAVYLEIYPPASDPVTHVVIDLSQRSPDREISDTLAVQGHDAPVPVVYRNRLADFHSGETQMKVRALDATGRQVGDALKSVFFVQWSLQTLVNSDWKRAVDMLVHIATNDELKALRATPPAERAAAFDRFWKSKDPTPETEENEWKDEYYRRIRFANQRFANPYRPGWRTDFGTVYIKYGQPDDVERYPFELDQKPHEIWYYYSQRRQFVFVDVRGNGEYELQYPYDGRIY